MTTGMGMPVETFDYRCEHRQQQQQNVSVDDEDGIAWDDG